MPSSNGVPGFDPAYMLDQSHNVTDPIESLMTSSIELVRAYVQAHLVDREKLAAYQAANDPVMALQTLKAAPSTTDVGPILAMARYRAGGAIDPVAVYRASGYRQRMEHRQAGGEREPCGHRVTVRRAVRSDDRDTNGGCMTRLMRFTLALLACGLVFGFRPAAAQESRGSIAGLVVDSSGGALPGVTVTIMNNGTNADSGADDQRARGSTRRCCCCRAPTPSPSS